MALTAPNAHNVPVMMSSAEIPQRTGAAPGSPVIDITPLNACISASYPASAARGPLRPKAETEQ